MSADEKQAPSPKKRGSNSSTSLNNFLFTNMKETDAVVQHHKQEVSPWISETTGIVVGSIEDQRREQELRQQQEDEEYYRFQNELQKHMDITELDATIVKVDKLQKRRGVSFLKEPDTTSASNARSNSLADNHGFGETSPPALKKVSSATTNTRTSQSRKARQSIVQKVRNIFKANKAPSSPSTTSNSTDAQSPQTHHLIGFREFKEQIDKEYSSQPIDIESLLRKYLSTVDGAWGHFNKEGEMYLKKSDGHFKERWVQLCVDSTGAKLKMWRSMVQRETKPLVQIDMTEFAVTPGKIMQTLNIRDTGRRDKKGVTGFSMTLQYIEDDAPKESIFCILHEHEFLDWLSVFELLHMKQFAFSAISFVPSMSEEMEYKVSEELSFLLEQRETLTEKYGQDRFSAIIHDYEQKTKDLIHLSTRTQQKV